jgi:hypothetical protein
VDALFTSVFDFMLALLKSLLCHSQHHLSVFIRVHLWPITEDSFKQVEILGLAEYPAPRVATVQSMIEPARFDCSLGPSQCRTHSPSQD